MRTAELDDGKLKKLFNITEADIRRDYREYRLTVPRSKRKYMIPYSEFRKRYLLRLRREYMECENGQKMTGETC